MAAAHERPVAPAVHSSSSSSSSLISSLLHSHVNLEWCDKIKLLNLLLPQKSSTWRSRLQGWLVVGCIAVLTTSNVVLPTWIVVLTIVVLTTRTVGGGGCMVQAPHSGLRSDIANYPLLLDNS